MHIYFCQPIQLTSYLFRACGLREHHIGNQLEELCLLVVSIIQRNKALILCKGIFFVPLHCLSDCLAHSSDLGGYSQCAQPCSTSKTTTTRAFRDVSIAQRLTCFVRKTRQSKVQGSSEGIQVVFFMLRVFPPA